MRYTIQDLKANTEYTLNLDVEIYDWNGAHKKLTSNHSTKGSTIGKKSSICRFDLLVIFAPLSP